MGVPKRLTEMQQRFAEFLVFGGPDGPMTQTEAAIAVQPSRSGVPCRLEFSSLIQEISGIDFLILAYNFRSGFKVTRAF